MRVAAAHLGQVVALLVESVGLLRRHPRRQAARSFDAIEAYAFVTLRYDALDGALSDAAGEPAHRMGDDAESALGMHRFQCGRQRLQARHRLFDEERKQVAFECRHLLA